MAITQVITNKADHLFLIDDGRIRNREEFLELCVETITKALQHGQKRLLLDNRTLSIEVTRREVLEVADQLAAMNAQELGFRFAVISSRASSTMARFVETSFTDRSAVYKRFDSQQEALSWLLSGPDGPGGLPRAE